jgi:hypothetical protein
VVSAMALEFPQIQDTVSMDGFRPDLFVATDKNSCVETSVVLRVLS